MTKKFVVAFAVFALMATSCKESATSKIKEDVQPVAAVPATPATPAEPVSAEPVAAVPADGKYPVMKFEKDVHDFGNLKSGGSADYSFSFKNTGEADLIITKAQGSCGCTVPEYPKEPIKPGESGKIKVSYNSGSQQGQQQKTVTLTTNTAAGTEKLTIKATVAAPPAG
ncbi:MAG: DUF1573 domain-containing protein [Flavobacterium sp.]|nr:DUF1573 domain-containing protein [Flavobacterium sp.]